VNATWTTGSYKTVVVRRTQELRKFARRLLDVGGVEDDALGVLLYELLAGITPFRSVELRKVGAAEIMRVIRETEPPRPSQKYSSSEHRASIAAARWWPPSLTSRDTGKHSPPAITLWDIFCIRRERWMKPGLNI
jgi:hypothetical protein